MDTLRNQFTFLTEEFTSDDGVQYLTDDDMIIVVSFKNNTFILSIMGTHYIVTNFIAEITAGLENINKEIKIEQTKAARDLNTLCGVLLP